MDLKEDAVLGSTSATHWYYVAKGRALKDCLGGMRVEEVLDVGAGSGIFARQLVAAGICRRAVCVDPNYSHDWTEQADGGEIEFRRSVEIVTQELILMMDVLEHVDDDLGLLRGYTDRMPAISQVLITVPAFQALWSGHDVFLEHRRRYTRRQIEELVRAAGLTLVRSSFFFCLLLPLAAAQRWLGRATLAAGKEAASGLRQYPLLLNRVLIAIHDLERRLLFRFNRIAGLTVFCLAARSNLEPAAAERIEL